MLKARLFMGAALLTAFTAAFFRKNAVLFTAAAARYVTSEPMLTIADSKLIFFLSETALSVSFTGVRYPQEALGNRFILISPLVFFMLFTHNIQTDVNLHKSQTVTKQLH